jgi:hypothetical protein
MEGSLKGFLKLPIRDRRAAYPGNDAHYRSLREAADLRADQVHLCKWPKGKHLRIKLGVILVTVFSIVGWAGPVRAAAFRLMWDGPPCIATEIRSFTGEELDMSKLVVRVIKPLRWANLPLSSVVSIHFSSEPSSQNYDRAQDHVTVDGGKTHVGTVWLIGPKYSLSAMQLNCVGPFENFSATARILSAPGVAQSAYPLRGLERVDDATVAAASAQQETNRAARAAALVQAKEQADDVANRAKQAQNEAAIANAMLIKQMGLQPIGSTLFCNTDPHWPRSPGDAVDRLNLVCHLVGKQNVQPIMGAALLTSGWAVMSENRRTEHNTILSVDMGSVEVTEVTLRKTL